MTMISKILVFISLLFVVGICPVVVNGFSNGLTHARSRTVTAVGSNPRFGVNLLLLRATPDKKSSSSSQNKLSKKRRDQLGIDEDDEYDVSYAISANTDSTITKIVAGSFIVVVIALLVVAVIIPSFQDYEGQCNPILNQGRC
jgi:hypothetical protein